MMNDGAISARSVSKIYPQHKGHGHALREAIDRTLRVPFNPSGKMQQPEKASPMLWALRDISFEIQQGDCVGLIGHNGAGKSVLLRVLSRVTRPTRGEADLMGQVSSVLEVGIGFNRELSGRENIFLQGAILGMRRREIERKFDEIVAFSGMEEFLQEPLKTYSNGMLVRMAFAISAHLEPDILLMDEVLAVADADFQQMCVAKLKALAQEGRTIMLASHDLDLLAQICTRALWLERGNLVEDGAFAQVASQYQTQIVQTTNSSQRQ
jgi:lipopolysaccharide transport system ATP-binding protein